MVFIFERGQANFLGAEGGDKNALIFSQSGVLGEVGRRAACHCVPGTGRMRTQRAWG